MTGMILMDPQKTFNTIDHDILLKKLRAIDFANHPIGWYKSYLSNRFLRVTLKNGCSDPFKITCGVPQRSIFERFLLLIYVNNMPHDVKSNKFLYPGDTCLVFQGKDVTEIEKQLNGDFTNICDWFADNRFSIHFGEDKIKSVLSATKPKIIKGSKTKNQLQKYMIK